MSAHEYYMNRALALASCATGYTNPNPLVGAVIVKNEKIIGEGFHARAGLAHAEVEAINNCSENPEGATIYVTLEPCSHYGKTPPCSQAILDAKISTVIFAVRDNNNTAAGGAEILAAKGVSVIAGVCEQQARYLNRFFFHFQATGFPYVVAKYAASLDGRTATRTGHSQWITGVNARQKAHALRLACDAILIGAQTAIADDPSLTVRLKQVETINQVHTTNPDQEQAEAGFLKQHLKRYTEIAHPLRVVLDSKGSVPLKAKLFNDEHKHNTLVLCSTDMPASHRDALSSKGVGVQELETSSSTGQIALGAVLKELGARQCQSLMVEGGQALLGSFADQNLIDEVWAFIAPMLIGGQNALPSIGGMGIENLDQAQRFTHMDCEKLGKDMLIRAYTTNSNAVH